MAGQFPATILGKSNLRIKRPMRPFFAIHSTRGPWGLCASLAYFCVLVGQFNCIGTRFNCLRSSVIEHYLMSSTGSFKDQYFFDRCNNIMLCNWSNRLHSRICWSSSSLDCLLKVISGTMYGLTIRTTLTMLAIIRLLIPYTPGW